MHGRKSIKKVIIRLVTEKGRISTATDHINIFTVLLVSYICYYVTICT